jgi:hypothetical protein
MYRDAPCSEESRITCTAERSRHSSFGPSKLIALKYKLFIMTYVNYRKRHRHVFVSYGGILALAYLQIVSLDARRIYVWSQHTKSRCKDGNCLAVPTV